MIAISKKESTIDGESWAGSNLAGTDSGITVMKVFLHHHFHNEWELTITDCKWRDSCKAKVPVKEIPQAVAKKFKEINATRISKVKENKKFKTYTVFMEYGEEYLKEKMRKEKEAEREKEAEFIDSIIEEEYIGGTFSNLLERED